MIQPQLMHTSVGYHYTWQLWSSSLKRKWGSERCSH